MMIFLEEPISWHCVSQLFWPNPRVRQNGSGNYTVNFGSTNSFSNSSWCKFCVTSTGSGRTVLTLHVGQVVYSESGQESRGSHLRFQIKSSCCFYKAAKTVLIPSMLLQLTSSEQPETQQQLHVSLTGHLEPLPSFTLKPLSSCSVEHVSYRTYSASRLP